MPKKSLLILVAVSAALSTPAHADLAAGLKAIEAADYAAAQRELKPLATAGDAEAAWHMARMHEHGWGVAANLSVAAGWYKKAGDAGRPEAQMRYGELLEQGLGVVRNRKEALDWYKKAANKGLAAAKTKVGLYALKGIAEKPNFLEAKRWLGEAAEAGDAEAQAILDDLAARRYPLIGSGGTAEPKEEAARIVLNEVKGLIEPLAKVAPGGLRVKLGQPPVVASAHGQHVVTLSGVDLVGQGTTVRLGSIKVAFKPDGGDYAVDVRLPSRARVLADGRDVGALTVGSQTITGRWSTDLHALTDYAAELGRIEFKAEALDFALSIGNVSGSRTFKPTDRGRYDVSEQIQLSGILVEGRGDDGQKGAVKAGLVGYAAKYEDIDLKAIARLGQQLGVDWRTGAGIRRSGAPPKDVAPMLKDMLLTARIKDIAVEGADGKRLAGLAGGEVSLAGANLDQALSALSLTYAHDGLGGDEAGQAPRRSRAMVTASRVPLSKLIGASLGALQKELVSATRRGGRGAVAVPMLDDLAQGGLAGLTQAVREARSELRINEMSLAGEAYDVTVAGVFQPAGDGFAGAVDVTVGGLDKFLEAVDAAALGDAAALRALAVRKQDKSGREVDVFNVALLASGKITVNGKDATFLLSAK